MVVALRSASRLCIPRDRSLRLDILDALALAENCLAELQPRGMTSDAEAQPLVWDPTRCG